MTGLNKILFLLFVSLIIFPAYALNVMMSSAHQDFKQRSEIKTNILNGEKTYAGTSSPLSYQPGVNVSKVIVYIIDRSRYVEIIRNAVRETRLQIAEELEQWNWELVFLGIANFDDDEHHLIGAFLLEKIQPHPIHRDQVLIVEVIGENRFDRSYQCHFVNFRRYRENDQICGGTLTARLRDIRHGALRPVANNDKEIKLRGYEPKVKEVAWSVRVENNKYFPEVNVDVPKYNFRIKYPYKKICVLVLGGKEYFRVTRLASRSSEWAQMREILEKMAKIDEALFILGALNFDWSEVYIVTQIILAHTKGWKDLDYNVFACGFGMFNTYYLNSYANDGRYIRQAQGNVLEIRETLLGEVKERVINMRFFMKEWKNLKIPISLGNGRYVPVDRYDFTFPWLNQRIAFIVYDSNEVNDPIDYLTAYQCMEVLERSSIYVVLIEAINFEFYDAHIIAEWIERHKGQIDPEQIAILGAGTFDTIFQSQHNTYNTFFDIGKNELRTIRNAFVKSGNEKGVLTAKMDDGNYEVWSYPMNTVVNGYYEPDLIPDKNIFDTTNGRKILFIITSAYNFQQISAIRNVGLVTSSFRETIDYQYPKSAWSVFLVGVDNFEKRDSHLFAELVKMQTHDQRSLAAFVHVISYGISHALYRYRDTEPFIIDFYAHIRTCIMSIFGSRCHLSHDPRLH